MYVTTKTVMKDIAGTDVLALTVTLGIATASEVTIGTGPPLHSWLLLEWTRLRRLKWSVTHEVQPGAKMSTGV
ncbi:unnamed protein product, partial [Allacma fusca]